jgi:SOS-response transcriptional repressor LexA
MELTNSTDTYFIDVPILGMANAGSPTLIAEENIEGYLKISKRLYNSQRVFAIRISGDSMNQSRINGKSIEDGDYVIVNQEGQNYKNNDRVLVVLDGLATVKTYRQVEDHIIGLFPESNNQTHRPIYLTPADDFIINGKIIDVLKNVEI